MSSAEIREQAQILADGELLVEVAAAIHARLASQLRDALRKCADSRGYNQVMRAALQADAVDDVIAEIHKMASERAS